MQLHAADQRPTGAHHSLFYVTVISAVSSVGAAVYALAAVQPSPSAELFIFYVPSLAVSLWLDADARLTRVADVHDWGFFLWIAWFLVLPWYVFKSRGRRGWRLALRLYVSAFAPFLTIIVLWTIRSAWHTR